ncbi:MAG: HAMP domain-containing histidine kinase [Acidimicrobiales bacterium]|nr:HAMP domain-containing histidine kinase [Acidimicrobiales bacterium]
MAATLVIAGLGTLVLANVRARTDTEQELRAQATTIAANLALFFDETDAPLDDQAVEQRLRQLTLLRRVVDLDGFAVVSLDPDLDPNQLPSGVDPELVDVDGLRTGRLTSTHDGELVMAAAPIELGDARSGAVVLARRADVGLGPAARYFVVAAVASASIALLAAVLVGRRISRPIQAASAAATRIAAGELATRLPVRAGRGDELDQLSRDVNEMAGTLERSRALEQQFLLSVSHDLRTPLTSIRGYAEAIADGAADPQRAAAVISAESRRLERLVADLLDLAKVQASSFSLELEPLDLAQLAEVAVDGFAPDATDRGLLLQAITPPLAVTVDADRDRLGQVAANLIENAMKYATTGVVVRVDTVGGRAVFTVTDDGAGIDPADLPHVFERLYVARRQPARRESSSGLGLAIVSQLVEAMGGEVSVTSEVGHGTTFAVMLPCRA